MSDDLEPRARKESDSQEFESLFESFQQREELPEAEDKPAVSKKGMLDMLGSLTGRRESGQKRREQVEQASTSPTEDKDTEPPPVFVREDGQMDIEAARQSFLADLEEDEGDVDTTVEPSSKEQRPRRGLAQRLGLTRMQGLILGVLLVMVLLVYVALGIIVMRSQSQWAEISSPEPAPTMTIAEETEVAAVTEPSPSPTLAEEDTEDEEPDVTSTPLPTSTPQPSVSTRFDLQVMRNPTDLELRQKRGEEYLRLQAYQEATWDFEYIVSQDQERAGAHLGLGQAYFFLRRWEEAEAELGTAISFNEDLEDAHFWLGKLLYLEGQYEKAMSEFDWAAEINPESPRNEAWLARAAVQNDDLTEAQGAAERALSLDDRYPLAYVAQAEVKILAENHEGAQGDMLYAKDLAPHHFEVLNAQARLYTDHFPDRLNEAEQLARQAENWATWSIEQARALHTLGRVYLAQGRREEALDALARASDLATVKGATALPELNEDFNRAIAAED